MSRIIEIKSTFEVYNSINELSEEDGKLLKAANNAINGAYAPYSQFFVGAAVLLENGEIVSGSNQENAAYPSGLCAERVAIFHASSLFPGIKILAIAVSVRSQKRVLTKPISPCGACRQSISEYEIRFDQAIKIIMGGDAGEVYVSPSISNLLPLMFTSKDLE